MPRSLRTRTRAVASRTGRERRPPPLRDLEREFRAHDRTISQLAHIWEENFGELDRAFWHQPRVRRIADRRDVLVQEILTHPDYRERR